MQARIHHVSIPVPASEQAAARAFYGNLLGLDEIPVPESLKTINLMWYRLDGDTELHLIAETPQAGRSARHFCIAVDEVEVLRSKLEEAGVAVVGAAAIPGRPNYFCRDPFGNLIEFTTIEFDYRSESEL
jgi:catechol 2,3-dioxygenase-like lactoylglutathione lyase family enzyme